MSKTDRKFAFGWNRIAGRSCPAITVLGGTEAPPVLHPVIRYYDGILMKRKDKHDGIVGEDLAREVWMEAIEHAEKEGYTGAVERAKIVADKLGWLDE